MMNKLAQINLAPAGGYKGFGALGLEQGQDGATIFQTFISSAIGLISVIAIIWFVFIIVSSGISYMGAGADQKATEAARKRISNGLIGLLLTIFGIFIINLVGQIFGIPGMLFIPGLITEITIK
jgi:uncharacterized membrane protein